jgi:hypothetical protein
MTNNDQSKRLKVRKETLRSLSKQDLDKVAGGGFIMKDTVIIPRR